MNSQIGLAAALMLGAPALAQPAPEQPAPVAAPQDAMDFDPAEDIVVTGARPRGTVVGDIQPDITLGRGDIRALGAGSLADILTELAPQTRSGQGRGGEGPVVLINGKRVSGFSEIRNIPPEAIDRVDILPEEVSLSYGYKADQRVINFVLRERFRAVTGEVEFGGPTAGGRGELELEANLLRIAGDSRSILDLEYSQSGLLLESERDILPSTPSNPFDLRGNIVSPTGGEIDPALSALAGTSVTVAAVPDSAAAGPSTLDDFVAGANAPSRTDLSEFRSLQAQTREFSIGGSVTRPLTNKVQATISARIEADESISRLGLPDATLDLPATNPFSPFTTDVALLRYADTRGPLQGRASAWMGRLATVINGDLSGWRWSFTASHDHAENRTRTDRSLDLSAVQDRITAGDPTLNPFADGVLAGVLQRDRSSSNSDLSVLDLVANGSPFDLPAGPVATSFKGGYERNDLSSSSIRTGAEQRTDLGRGKVRGQASIDVPLTSRRRAFLGALGDLSVNLNLSADELTDFGTLTSIGYGLTWQPVRPLRIIASVTHEDGAPTIQQLGNPLVATPNVRVFDFVRGETVDITRLDGGNPDLAADRRRVLKLAATLKPIEETDLTLTANYVDSRVTGPIASFPTATAEIEAAFPERFLRDADGRLLQIDNRPVNFARSDRRELRWGVSFSERLEPTRAERAEMEKRRAEFEERRKARAGQQASGVETRPGEAAAADHGAQGQRSDGRGQGGFPGGRGGGFGGRGGAEGRFTLSLFHTWRLEDSIRIRDGVPDLDLLNGSATGSSGGVSRHEIEARAGVNKNGLGARVALNWRSGTEVLVDPQGPSSPDDLSFSSLATVNLRLFADLGQRRDLVRRHSWLRGARVSIGVDNLFDSRLDVTDASGATPIGYQPDILDPIGRRIEISFRKLFF